MGRSRDPYQIPKVGVEIAPLAGFASVNINRSVGPVSSTEFVGESTLGGVLVYAIYQALLTGLRTEAMRKRGALDRQTQIRLVAESVWASAKEGAAVSAVLGVVLVVFPWMAFPLSVMGVFGAGKATMDLVDSFWDGLTNHQKEEIELLAYESGIYLRELLKSDAI